MREKILPVLNAGPLPIVLTAIFLFVLSMVTARADIAAYVVFDAKSGTVIDQKNAMRPWHPASLTKMMTAYVTFTALRAGRLRTTSPVYYSANARSEPPSKMGFKVGTILTVDNALKMVVVKSANDVAVALGETVAGSESAFVGEMNRHAQRLGMSSTRFTNPNGLPNRSQITNARDFGLLAQALYRDFPEYAHYFRIGAIKLGKRVLRSHNVMLRHYRGADGMKTGYICDSGLNLVATAKRGGRRIVAVVMGSRSGYERAAVTRVLLDRGFSRTGGIFSPSGSRLRRMRPSRNWPALPAKGYCRSGARPKIADLLAKYGRQPTSYGTSAVIYDDNGRIRPNLPGVSTRAIEIDKKPKKKGRKKKKRKGMPAHEVLARLVGPERAVSVIPVYIGGADARRPVAHLKPIDGIKPNKRSARAAIPPLHPLRNGATARSTSPSRSALAIQPVTRPAGEAAAASLFARSNSARQSGSPEVLLPAATSAPTPRKIGGIPFPRPRPAH